MSLIPDGQLQMFDTFVAGDMTANLLGKIMQQHASSEEAQQGTRELLARPAFTGKGPPPWNSQTEWARHDWLSQAVNEGHVAWAHALLDQAVDPRLTILNGKHCLQAGWVLREAMKAPQPEPRLMARLWGLVEVNALVTSLCQTFKERPQDAVTLRQIDLTALWLLDRLDGKPNLDTMVGTVGDQPLPLYTAALQARERAARTPDLPSEGIPRPRFRS